MTTIAIPKDLKKNISEFGNKGETFSDILTRLCENARKQLLQNILMSEGGCISLDEFKKEINKKWPKS